MQARRRSRWRTTAWCSPFCRSSLACRSLGALFAYTTTCRKNDRQSFTHLQTEDQRRALAAKHLPCAHLRTLPGGRDALQELAPFRGDLEPRTTLVRFVRPLLDPALLEDDLQVTRQRRGIEVKPLAEVDPPHQTGLSHGDQQVELTWLEAPIAHLGFIDTGEHPVHLAPVAQQALARNLVDDARMGRGTPHNKSLLIRYLYIQVLLSRASPDRVLRRQLERWRCIRPAGRVSERRVPLCPPSNRNLTRSADVCAPGAEPTS